MSVLSPTFELTHDAEYQLMKLDPNAPDYRQRVAAYYGEARADEKVAHYRASVEDALGSNVPLGRRVLHTDDFLPEKAWRVLACDGYICDDPYTGSEGVQDLGGGRYRVSTRLATAKASSVIHFTFKLKDSLEETRLVFSPLLVRFMSGADWTTRPVKISDSGRVRNELQTLLSQALEFEGQHIHVYFDRVDEKVLPLESQRLIRRVLEWYKTQHPVWFGWLHLH